jgi:acyl-CoA reductase-like NAD-dependent aldehyde dehydrogenase
MMPRRQALATSKFALLYHVQAGIYDQFSKAVVEQVNKFKLGDGLVDGTTLGPLISPAAVDRVRQRLLGAPSFCGGVMQQHCAVIWGIW